MKPSLTFFTLVFSICSLSAAPKGKMNHPDFTKGDKIPEGAVHDWNLGAIGARGWIYSHKMSTSQARQILITKVEKESPADGMLQEGDVILGAEGNVFSSDPRTAFGKALTNAENSGALKLIRWRGGKTENITIKLSVLGSYSATAPFDCIKSKRLLEQGCVSLAKRMTEPNYHRGRHSIVRSLNALALLASGDKQYLPLLKKEATWAANFTSNGYKSWEYSYTTIFLAEYIIATKDQSVMAGLRRLSLEIANGQSPVGSWGHRFKQEDGKLGGYGMMNSPGIPLTIALFLAREAGVKDDIISEAISKSAKLLRFYVGKGAIPYGDHHPWIKTHEDNGKCGMAAVLFNLLGDKDAARFFSHMSSASHSNERDTGHTGNFFNLFWAMPGVIQSGPQASGAWMKEYGTWYYDLARQWDGSYIHQGPPSMKKDSYRNWDCTGAYLIALAMPLKHLYLTGKKGSILVPLSRQQAQALILDGRDSYDKTDYDQIISRLGSWSPVVRERAALAIRKLDNRRSNAAKIIALLDSPKLNTRIGACQALAQLKSAAAVPALQKCLNNDKLWLRVKAAEALAAIGKPAMPALPKLLEMLVKGSSKNDPRGMEQRYLSFAVFDKMLKHGGLETIDKALLNKAIIASLKNQDGRARGSIGRVYDKLSYAEIKPLLPAIYQATKEPAPSGIMFAAGIRLSGIELLAKHRIKEGMPLCLEVMEIHKWGKGRRIPRCLNALANYGGAAKPLLPQIIQLKHDLSKHREAKKLKPQLEQLKKIIKAIEDTKHVPELRSIK